LRAVAPGPDFEEALWEKIRISREIQRQPSAWRSGALSPRLVWWGGGVVAVGASALGLVFLLNGAPRPEGRASDVSQFSMSGETVAPSPDRAPNGLPLSTTDEREVPGHVEASPFLTTSVPQAGDETAPPVSGARVVASAPGSGRLEPGSQGTEFYFEDVQLVPDPSLPGGGYYPVRQAVMARPGEGRISF
jgi:hypothetical protein